MQLADMLRRCAHSFDDRAAYIDGPRVRTWAEMDQRSDALASALEAQGVRAGDASVVLSQDRIEVLEHFFACLKLGAIRVGANFRYSAAEVAHVVRDSGATSIVVEASCRPLLAEAAETLEEREAMVVGFGDGHGLAHDYETLLAQGDRPAPRQAADEEIAAIAYTAGTTGLPKGVLWTHGGLRTGLERMIINVGFRPEDVWLSALPAAAGPLVFVAMNMVNGMTTVLPGGRFASRRFLELIEGHGVTATMLVPTMVRDVIAELDADSPPDVSSLRLFAYGAMPAPPALVRDIRAHLDCELQQWYGSTEMAGIVAILRDAEHVRALDHDPELLRSCGRACGHVDIEIRSEEGEMVAPGESGELWVRSESLFAGYHNLPEESAGAMEGGWFRPGDIARMDEHGYIRLLDRKNFMIISGGYNTYPSVIEAVLCDHPAVREAAAVGLPHPRWGEAVAAAVTLHDGADADVEVLTAFSAERLAKWEVPKHLSIVETLPQGSTGKLDRRAVRDRLQAEGVAWSTQEGVAS